MIKLSLDKVKRHQIEQCTSFLDEWYDHIPLKIRCLVIQNKYDENSFPRCICCNKPVSFKKDYHNGFNKFCSEICHRKHTADNKMVFSHPLLSDKLWLFNQRVEQKKSIEQIANELSCSTVPVRAAISYHDIPKIRLNESISTTQNFLQDKEWLVKEHCDNHQTLEEISKTIGSSKATVSRWLHHHNIEPNKPNSYDRSFNRNSKGCQEVIDFLIENNAVIEVNNRSILQGKEIDIWIPSHKLAIEYNGIFWHSFCPFSEKDSIRKDQDYHSWKTAICRDQNIQLIHLWEDDWRYKRAIWESRLLQLVKKTPRKIGARQCTITKINSYQKGQFLRENHLQGNDCSSISYGLWFNDELVSVMTFRKARFTKKYKWELSRFCNKCCVHVQGSFSKLLSQFIHEFPKESIVSYADKSYSLGDVYVKNGFIKISESKSNFWYVSSDQIRLHRSNFMKKKIAPNDSRTENEIMEEMHFKKIFGPGVMTFVLEHNLL